MAEGSESLCIDRSVVHVSDHCPLETQASAPPSEIAVAGSDEVVDGVSTIDRHQLVPEFVISGVQRDGEGYR